MVGFNREMLMKTWVDKPWSGRLGSFTAAHWMVGSDVNGRHGDVGSASGRRAMAGNSVKEENVRGRGGWEMKTNTGQHYSG